MKNINAAVNLNSAKGSMLDNRQGMTYGASKAIVGTRVLYDRAFGFYDFPEAFLCDSSEAIYSGGSINKLVI